MSEKEKDYSKESCCGRPLGCHDDLCSTQSRPEAFDDIMKSVATKKHFAEVRESLKYPGSYYGLLNGQKDTCLMQQDRAERWAERLNDAHNKALEAFREKILDVIGGKFYGVVGVKTVIEAIQEVRP